MRILIACCVLIFSLLAHADGIADLKAFIEQSRSLSADFTQTVVDQNGKKTQTSHGTMLIQRPGKFHWRYYEPFPSEIVGDGQKVWLYDPELKQVTVKKMGDAIESSPAALLAGNNHFEKNYQIKNLPASNTLTWIEAIPKAKDSTFQRVRIGLRDRLVERIELVDQLGQTTTVIFAKIILNPAIKSSEFVFTLPKGVDVISE